jgi:hypothetical protein
MVSEMAYRSLYRFIQAYQRSKVTNVVAYPAVPTRLLGIRQHKFERSSPIKLDLTSWAIPYLVAGGIKGGLS